MPHNSTHLSHHEHCYTHTRNQMTNTQPCSCGAGTATLLETYMAGVIAASVMMRFDECDHAASVMLRFDEREHDVQLCAGPWLWPFAVPYMIPIVMFTTQLLKALFGQMMISTLAWFRARSIETKMAIVYLVGVVVVSFYCQRALPPGWRYGKQLLGQDERVILPWLWPLVVPFAIPIALERLTSILVRGS